MPCAPSASPSGGRTNTTSWSAAASRTCSRARCPQAAIRRAHYGVHLCDRTHPYPGILDLLERITARGVRIAVASNKYQAGAETVIGHFFGKFDWVTVLGQREGFPIKPDPGKDEVLYVGDSNVDMQTGIGAGVDTVGVTWGFRSREELAAFRPTALVDTPAELEELVLR